MISYILFPFLNKEICPVGELANTKYLPLLSEVVSEFNNQGIEMKIGCGIFSTKLTATPSSYFLKLFGGRTLAISIPFVIVLPSIKVRKSYYSKPYVVYNGFIPFLHIFGQHIFFRKEILSELDEKQYQLVLVHELGHILGLGHKPYLIEYGNVMNESIFHFKFITLPRAVQQIKVALKYSQITIGY